MHRIISATIDDIPLAPNTEHFVTGSGSHLVSAVWLTPSLRREVGDTDEACTEYIEWTFTLIDKEPSIELQQSVDPSFVVVMADASNRVAHEQLVDIVRVAANHIHANDTNGLRIWEISDMDASSRGPELQPHTLCAAPAHAGATIGHTAPLSAVLMAIISNHSVALNNYTNSMSNPFTHVYVLAFPTQPLPAALLTALLSLPLHAYVPPLLVACVLVSRLI